MAQAAEMARFYARVAGGCPYPGLTLALIEHNLPGGHSPAYVTIVNQVLPSAKATRRNWAGDPATFAGLPGVRARARSGPPVVGAGRRHEELPRPVDQRGLRAVLRGARMPSSRTGRSPTARSSASSPGGPGTRATRAPSTWVPGWATSRETAASSARWSTTRARWCSTCCASSLATRSSSGRIARFYAGVPLPQGRHRRRAARVRSRGAAPPRAVLRRLDLRAAPAAPDLQRRRRRPAPTRPSSRSGCRRRSRCSTCRCPSCSISKTARAARSSCR